MQQPRYPALYQINTRLRLNELARALGRPATLDDIPDSELDWVAEQGFHWLWYLGVWRTGPASKQVSLTAPSWRREFLELLRDLKDDDVCGSPYAIQGYSVQGNLGSEDSLPRLRQRLRERGLRLLLDFVPNHTSLDHPWVFDRPEFYVHGNENDLLREPQNYRRLDTRLGPRVLALGRDPFFPGWPDTLQLNYRHSAARQAVLGELLRVARLCDGVRCDMAMLLLPEVFTRTWGIRSLPSDGTPPVDTPFWPEAISLVREHQPGFLFMAEVYWDLEWTLQQQGFDYTYDKRHYDRVHARDPGAIRGHLWADPEFQRKSVRFLENHDEPRAASAFPRKVHEAAAILTFFVPGLRFFHEGQFEGRRMKASVHLCRRPDEPIDAGIHAFYLRLLECLRRPEVHDGRWQLLDCRRAWEENRTWERFVAFAWQGEPGHGGLSQRLLVVVNYGPSQGQCYIVLPFPELRGRKFLLRDLMSSAHYERDGEESARRGIYFDLPEWGYHVFAVTAG